MSKYIVQITIGNKVSNGCYRDTFNTLSEVRLYCSLKGSSGDLVTILRNGDCLANAINLVIP